MEPSLIFLTICGMGAVTYLPRVLPMLLLSRRRLAPWITQWLGFVPATVLAALLAPELLCRNGTLVLHPDENIFFLAALPTFLVACRFNNFFGTVATGMGLVALARYFMA